MLTKPIAPADAETAAAICDRFEVGAAARALLSDGLSPEAFVFQMEKKEMYVDALGFLAHWLPRREAVWWGCQCIWDVSRPKTSIKAEAALQAAVRWVVNPEETPRRAAEAAAEAATMRDPAGCLAFAAFWSGGSMSAAGLPPVEPPPGLTAATVTTALLVAAALTGKPPQPSYRQFVSLGLDIAHGKNLWT